MATDLFQLQKSAPDLQHLNWDLAGFGHWSCKLDRAAIIPAYSLYINPEPGTEKSHIFTTLFLLFYDHYFTSPILCQYLNIAKHQANIREMPIPIYKRLYISKFKLLLLGTLAFSGSRIKIAHNFFQTDLAADGSTYSYQLLFSSILESLKAEDYCILLKMSLLSFFKFVQFYSAHKIFFMVTFWLAYIFFQYSLFPQKLGVSRKK